MVSGPRLSPFWNHAAAGLLYPADQLGCRQAAVLARHAPACSQAQHLDPFQVQDTLAVVRCCFALRICPLASWHMSQKFCGQLALQAFFRVSFCCPDMLHVQQSHCHLQKEPMVAVHTSCLSGIVQARYVS